MSKLPNSKDNDVHSSCCFTTILQSLICNGNNLPSQTSHADQKPENPAKIHPFTRPLTRVDDPGMKSDIRIQIQVQDHANNKPGIIAKLMGLDSLPELKVSSGEIRFRSKSMNSLHFLPDFDPTRAAFHRRARTSASFHEQGHNKLLVKMEGENSRGDHHKGIKVNLFETSFEVKTNKQRKNNEKKEKEVVVLKDDERNKSRQNNGSKKRYDECYATTSSSCGRRRSKLNNNNHNHNNNNNYNNNHNHNHNNNNSNVGEIGVISDSYYAKEKSVKQKRRSLVKKNRDKINYGRVVSSTSYSSKKKVDDNQKQDYMSDEVVQSDVLLLSRSSVSVHHHLQNEFSPIFKGEERATITSKERRKSSPKSKFYDHITHDIIVPKSKQNNQDCCSNRIGSKQVVEATDCLVEMLGHTCKLAEDQINDSKWVANYDVLKVQFMEELCLDLSQELLDLLLDELLVDVIIMSL